MNQVLWSKLCHSPNFSVKFYRPVAQNVGVFGDEVFNETITHKPALMLQSSLEKLSTVP